MGGGGGGCGGGGAGGVGAGEPGGGGGGPEGILADGASGTGKVFHWGRIAPANKDISESRHYPLDGAYDSHDPALIDRHCRWAKQAGIDAWIVSWWGHGSFCDRALPKVLAGCERSGDARGGGG